MSRYIDADKIIYHLKDEMKCWTDDTHVAEDMRKVQYGTYLGLLYAKSLVYTAETADVKEVRHGHWIPEKDIERFGIWDTFICSKCCHRTLTECNYCPHCGAKMDEEEA